MLSLAYYYLQADKGNIEKAAEYSHRFYHGVVEDRESAVRY